MSLFGYVAGQIVGAVIPGLAGAPLQPGGIQTQAAYDQYVRTINSTRARYGLPPIEGLRYEGGGRYSLVHPTPKEEPVSLLGDIGRAIAPAVGGWIGGYSSIGAAAGTQIGTAVAQYSAARSSLASQVTMPGAGVMNTMASLPRIAGALGTVAGTVVGAVSLGARTIYRSASVYCRRHPAWCAQIGGTAAIAAMIQNGQLPPIKRRRGRGISPSEFRGFRRVHNVLKDFCAPRMRVRSKGLRR